METRLIDANALITSLQNVECETNNMKEKSLVEHVLHDIVPKIVIDEPTVDAVPVKLYHVTTPKKAKRYRETGAILKPVRGFTTLEGAMAWAIKTGRTVIYEVEGAPAYKLPDHHNKFGDAWWIDSDVPVSAIKCVRFE